MATKPPTRSCNSSFSSFLSAYKLTMLFIEDSPLSCASNSPAKHEKKYRGGSFFGLTGLHDVGDGSDLQLKGDLAAWHKGGTPDNGAG